jgi:hypothetical protein
MVLKFCRLVVKNDTKDLVRQCIEQFKKENPKLDGLRVTEDFLIRKFCMNYMKW